MSSRNQEFLEDNRANILSKIIGLESLSGKYISAVSLDSLAGVSSQTFYIYIEPPTMPANQTKKSLAAGFKWTDEMFI